MIGLLPTSLEVNGVDYKINSDYRVALLILSAFNDNELNEYEVLRVVIECLYVDEIPQDDIEEAYNKAVWFLDCGDTVSKPHNSKPVYDWEQDEQMIFSSINKVAGKEVRAVDYMHFWTFVGLFNEIGDGMFASVVNIRQKRNKGKKLDKSEQEFYKQNREIITLKKRYTRQEQEILDSLKDLI